MDNFLPFLSLSSQMEIGEERSADMTEGLPDLAQVLMTPTLPLKDPHRRKVTRQGDGI